MSAAEQAPLPHPGFDLEPPGTYLYTGPASTQGYRFNKFALTLTSPRNRADFLADEEVYMARHGLADAEKALVRARDWTGMVQAGVHTLAALKLAATLSMNLYHIGGHNAGTDAAAMEAACPRRVAGIPGEAG